MGNLDPREIFKNHPENNITVVFKKRDGSIRTMLAKFCSINPNRPGNITVKDQVSGQYRTIRSSSVITINMLGKTINYENNTASNS